MFYKIANVHRVWRNVIIIPRRKNNKKICHQHDREIQRKERPCNKIETAKATILFRKFFFVSKKKLFCCLQNLTFSFQRKELGKRTSSTLPLKKILRKNILNSFRMKKKYKNSNLTIIRLKYTICNVLFLPFKSFKSNVQTQSRHMFHNCFNKETFLSKLQRFCLIVCVHK